MGVSIAMHRCVGAVGRYIGAVGRCIRIQSLICSLFEGLGSCQEEADAGVAGPCRRGAAPAPTLNSALSSALVEL